MKIAFQMDPIDAVDINADSSFRLSSRSIHGKRTRVGK